MSKIDYTPMNGHFFLRGKGDGKAMMIGVLDDNILNVPNSGEIWLVQIIITDLKRYKAPPCLKDKRADQVLCMAIPVEGLEEITGD